MSKYDFDLDMKWLDNGRAIVTINSSDGSGDDDDNKFHVYAEDLDKLIDRLQTFKRNVLD